MPAIPRVGEEVALGGNTLIVRWVCHKLTQHKVEVTCECDLLELCSAYLEDEVGWKIDHQAHFEKTLMKFTEKLHKLSGRNNFKFIFADK
jgi:hypothetical protein